MARLEGDVLFSGDAFDLVDVLPEQSIDLIFSSPPYCMGKSYETSSSVADFIACHEAIVPKLVRLLKPGGSICWQVGYHSDGKQLTPLDFLAHSVFAKSSELKLRNRIIWTFAHGLHAKNRFSGRHELILWYSKGQCKFNLDEVRVPQKYPGKRYYKGPKKGELSGNPLGKNPGDVWEIPNVKSWHVEKTEHPCQFPVGLPQNFIRAVCPKGGLVFDPFMGVGSTGVAAAIEGRRFLGAEIQESYVDVAKQRIGDARRGLAKVRPLDRPIHEPKPTDSVARKPDHFRG
ncbi:MAG TPA: site-specific DNA-methyltransferase [Pseudoxanthomonas sp.]|nr:site-specific DNA-methyltransferase [Pseudoxanthomonas sp.]